MDQGQFTQWVRQVKIYVDKALISFLRQHKSEVSFAVPEKCSMILPLDITQAASGASLSAFREEMNYDNLAAAAPTHPTASGVTPGGRTFFSEHAF